MAAATFLALAANSAVGTIAAASFLGIWLLHGAARPVSALRDVTSVRLPWLYPAVALLSVAWSQAAPISLRLGIQLLLTTAIGVLVARAVRPERFVSALFVSLLVICTASLAVGGNVAVGVSGETASVGLFGSKNYQASIGAVLIMGSLAGLVTGGGSRLLRGLAFPALIVGFLTLLRSKSAGATITAIGASTILLGVVALGQIPRRARAPVLAVLIMLGAIASVALVSIGAEARDAVLGAFGKDAGLTGRTYLWFRAEDSIRRDPLLGVGYQAFWVKENVEAEGLWRYGFIERRSGFHFHNLYYEATVELGLLGLAALVTTLVLTVGATLRWSLKRADAAGGFFLAYVSFTMLRSFGEVELTFPFEFGPVIFAAVWVYATRASSGARWQSATGRATAAARSLGWLATQGGAAFTPPAARR